VRNSTDLTPIRIRSFPPGPWLIAWLGDVGLHISGRSFSQMSFTIELQGLEENKGHTRSICLPIGMLGLTPMGSHWRDGVRFNSVSGFEKIATFYISTSAVKLKPAGASFGKSQRGEFVLPFTHYGRHGGHTKSSLAVCAVSADTHVVIPALELIRFYFGSSGALLRHIFKHDFCLDSVCDSTTAHLDNWHGHIDLGVDIPGSSATDIGRLAFDETAYSH
jgi:hypothetical protein